MFHHYQISLRLDNLIPWRVLKSNIIIFYLFRNSRSEFKIHILMFLHRTKTVSNVHLSSALLRTQVCLAWWRQWRRRWRSRSPRCWGTTRSGCPRGLRRGMLCSLRRKKGHIFCLERAECSKSLNGEEIQKKNSVMARKRQLRI